MKLKFKTERYNIELKIDGYEFDTAFDFYDLNWLRVRAIYKDLVTNQIFIKEGNCILTFEIAELILWLKYENSIDNNKFNFIEPCIEFYKKRNKIILELCFDLSIVSDCIKSHYIIREKKDLDNLISILKKYLIKFPIRK